MYDIPSLMVNIVDVEILIYNTVGTLVRTLDEGDKGAGQHTTLWDGRNDDGEKVSSGVYFYQLRAKVDGQSDYNKTCLLYTSPSPRDATLSRMPSYA